MMRQALILVVALAASAKAPWELANGYAVVYNQWAAMRNERVNDPAKVGTVSAKEFQLWQRVKSARRAFEDAIDAEYRGER